MIVIDFYKNQNVGVLGLGATGLATAAALQAGAAQVIAWDDDRATRKRALHQLPTLTLTPPEAKSWRGLDLFVPSPGINESYELIKDLTLLKIKMLGDVELFALAIAKAQAQVKVVAITGTNGKSTTTALTAHTLKQAGLSVEMGGNIGVPVLALSPFAKDRIYVLEISSYQADRLETLRPDIAVQLNLTPDHTGRHGSLEKYAAAKAKLFANQNKNDCAIINTRDTFGKALYQKSKAQKIELQKVRLPATLDIKAHNKENIAASYEIARACGLTAKQFAQGVESWKSLPHRQELIAEINGVKIINDSKATNAEAARPALARYKNIHWLAGGAAKEEGFDALSGALGNINHAYLFGSGAQRLSAFLQGRVSHSTYKTMEEATRAALASAKSGVILLSPACASFDAYRDFAQRGDAFGRAVRRAGSPQVVIGAGGTGGGVFPALGLADSLRRRGLAVHLVCDKRGLSYLPKHSRARHLDSVRVVSSAPMAARSVLGMLSASFFMALGIVQSLFLLTLRVRGAKVIVGFGGYPSVPLLVAGVILRVPLVLHEPGAVLGRANKMLLPFAKVISLGAPLKQKISKSRVIGNPLRPQIKQAQNTPYEKPQKNTPWRVLVFAGSQGAQWFDENIPAALCAFARAKKINLSVVQQCRSQTESIKKLYDENNITARLSPFFDDIEQEIAQSHLVIARAGASTISELTLLARPAILIPHRGAAPGAEQKSNAENFMKLGFGAILEEQNFTPEALKQKIEKLMAGITPSSLPATAPTTSDSADKLADIVLERANV